MVLVLVLMEKNPDQLGHKISCLPVITGAGATGGDESKNSRIMLTESE